MSWSSLSSSSNSQQLSQSSKNQNFNNQSQKSFQQASQPWQNCSFAQTIAHPKTGRTKCRPGLNEANKWSTCMPHSCNVLPLQSLATTLPEKTIHSPISFPDHQLTYHLRPCAINRYSQRRRNSHPIAISSLIQNFYPTWSPGCSASNGLQPQFCQSRSEDSQPQDPLLHLLSHSEARKRQAPRTPASRNRQLPA